LRWQAANVIVQMSQVGVSREVMREVSMRTVMRVGMVAEAWERSAQSAVKKDDNAPRKATQADIRAMLQ
jgi:hypothetical protein